MIVHKSHNCLKCKNMNGCNLSPEGCGQFERANPTPEKRTNALAELAERLGKIDERYPLTIRQIEDVDSAQRIVAELAKVKTLGPKHIPGDIGLYKAYAEIRAIAEEGAGDVRSL